jgi:hypothetical protein
MEQALTDEEEDLPEPVIDELCLKRADVQFQEACVGPLERNNPLLAHARSFGQIIYRKAASRLLMAFAFPTYLGLAKDVISSEAQAALANLIHIREMSFRETSKERCGLLRQWHNAPVRRSKSMHLLSRSSHFS